MVRHLKVALMKLDDSYNAVVMYIAKIEAERDALRAELAQVARIAQDATGNNWLDRVRQIAGIANRATGAGAYWNTPAEPDTHKQIVADVAHRDDD